MAKSIAHLKGDVRLFVKLVEERKARLFVPTGKVKGMGFERSL